MENESNTSILSLLTATAIGIGIGLLIAPEKGTDMRKKVIDTANDLGAKAGEAISAGKDKLKEISGTVTNQAEGLANDVSNRSTKVKNEWEKM